MQKRTLTSLLLATLVSLFSCHHPAGHIAEPAEICGCMDIKALNNNPVATKCDPTQCRYAIDSVTGIYDVVDTYVVYTSRGPDTFVTNMAITVTRESSSALLFDNILVCAKCTNGGIGYTQASHSFFYSSYSDPYTSNTGEGKFVGNTIRYKQQIINSFSGITPSHRGSGVKRN